MVIGNDWNRVQHTKKNKGYMVRPVAAPAFSFRMGDTEQKNFGGGQQKCALFWVINQILRIYEIQTKIKKLDKIYYIYFKVYFTKKHMIIEQ